MKYTYLLINFFSVIIPFLFSFYPKIEFYKAWRYYIPSTVLVAIVFVLWDMIFTAMNVWHFNPAYVSGIYILNLPVEEVLFFFCIPYACVFTWFCLTKFYNLQWTQRAERIFCILFSLLLLAISVVYVHRIYTFITFVTTALVCMWLVFGARASWFGSAVTVYAILLLPFFIVNGLLTGSWIGEPVVLYNPDTFMGYRILTIPVEDAVYGFELILLNIYGMKLFEKKAVSRR